MCYIEAALRCPVYSHYTSICSAQLELISSERLQMTPKLSGWVLYARNKVQVVKNGNYLLNYCLVPSYIQVFRVNKSNSSKTAGASYWNGNDVSVCSCFCVFVSIGGKKRGWFYTWSDTSLVVLFWWACVSLSLCLLIWACGGHRSVSCSDDTDMSRAALTAPV